MLEVIIIKINKYPFIFILIIINVQNKVDEGQRYSSEELLVLID